MIAVEVGFWGIRAGPEAEGVVTHIIRPLMILLQNTVRIAEYETSDRISRARSAVRVKLATLITVGDVQHSQIADAGHLNIVRCLYEVSTGDGTVRD